MCGIAGLAGTVDRRSVEAMTRALAHRGPNSEGYFFSRDPPLAFGHRRLAVIDIAGGHQPMWNEDGSVAVIFNGEIYNHEELRAELVRMGHAFASDHSDTEVLVHGWEQWRDALPERLNGMFAFAIWDSREQSVFLARDRFGEKPLYYSLKGGVLSFASELNALALSPTVDGDIDRLALKKFFAYGYFPAPHTILADCRKLPAGHHLRFDLRSSKALLKCYWSFSLQEDESIQDRDEPRLVEELQGHISRAVQRRLISDVPLGFFLSGGIDSSTVLAFARQIKPSSELKTFTIGFDEPSYDESCFANEVARLFGVEHHCRVFSLARANEIVPSILGRLDEPLGDSSIVPTHLLSAFARETITVALSGDGGDELFAGYDPFAALGVAKLCESILPMPMRRGLRRLADLLPVGSTNMSFDFKIRRGLMGMTYPASARTPIWMAPLEPHEIADLFQEPCSVEELYSEAIEAWEGRPRGTDTARMLEFFTKFYLSDDILTKTDRASMMVSLEVRSVFLDNDLVDFCRRLPNRFKYRNGVRKYLLKKAVEPFLPRHIVERKKKGFGMPIADWLRTIPATAPEFGVCGLNVGMVDRYWHEHRSHNRDYRSFLWCWLAFRSKLDALKAERVRADPLPA